MEYPAINDIYWFLGCQPGCHAKLCVVDAEGAFVVLGDLSHIARLQVNGTELFSFDFHGKDVPPVFAWVRMDAL